MVTYSFRNVWIILSFFIHTILQKLLEFSFASRSIDITHVLWIVLKVQICMLSFSYNNLFRFFLPGGTFYVWWLIFKERLDAITSASLRNPRCRIWWWLLESLAKLCRRHGRQEIRLRRWLVYWPSHYRCFFCTFMSWFCDSWRHSLFPNITLVVFNIKDFFCIWYHESSDILIGSLRLKP